LQAFLLAANYLVARGNECVSQQELLADNSAKCISRREMQKKEKRSVSKGIHCSQTS